MIFYGTFVLVIILITLYLYQNLKKKLTFFEKRGIPYEKPNWIFGNFTETYMFKKSLSVVCNELYEKLRPHKFGGIFIMQDPVFMIRDPDLIKCVFTKDFSHFQNRGDIVHRDIEPLAYHLSSMNGDEWKNLRTKLTSAFSIRKMKMMFPLIKQCGEHLAKVVDNIVNSEKSFDARDLTGRYLIDSIGSSAFGMETNSLENLDSVFGMIPKNVPKFKYLRILRSMFPNMPKKLITLLNLKLVDDEVSRFSYDIIAKMVKHREENHIIRFDLLDLLIAMKNNTSIKKFHDNKITSEDLEPVKAEIGNKHTESNIEMTVDVMAAQCFLLLSGGFEVTSIVMSFLLLELSLNPEIQDKVRNEIKNVLKKHNDEFTYESMKEMTYTDMVIAETLRRHPPVGRIKRLCNEAYLIPDTDIIIPKNMLLIIPVQALHYDKKYYERPEDFYPEHFTEDAKASRLHYTYLPYGEGPRNCFARQFGVMLVKIGLVNMLQNFSYQISPRMKLPIEFTSSFFPTVKNGIWLKPQKI